MTGAEAYSNRLIRHKAFFNRKEAGDILFCRPLPCFYPHWQKILQDNNFENLRKQDIEKINDDCLQKFRNALEKYYRIQDDSLPSIEVYFGIGAVTAAMSGQSPRFVSGTSWCEPFLIQEEQAEKLEFDANNSMLKLHLMVYQNLADHWEEDFLLTPFIHRSPLDAAWGMRGNDLFFDFFDRPEFVAKLVSWCADWSIEAEHVFQTETNRPDNLERGVWNVWLPETCVFVNGDPVDLISSDLQQEFERPYTEKLFTSLGGGFFHHHSMGISQVTNISKTKGMILQNIHQDPNVPDIFDILLNKPDIREQVLQSSMICPIHLSADGHYSNHYLYSHIDSLLPILLQGRFIIRYLGDDIMAEKIVEKLNRLRKDL